MKYYLLLLSTLFVISSCDKVETPKSYEEMLRDGSWRMTIDGEKGIGKEGKRGLLDTVRVDTVFTQIIYDKDSNIVPDGYINDSLYNVHNLWDCKADDFLAFRENGNGAHNTGEVKCPPGESQEIAIRWGFRDNYRRMYIYNAGHMFMGNDDLEGDVVNFSSSSFTLVYKEIKNMIGKFDTSTYTVTLNRF